MAGAPSSSTRTISSSSGGRGLTTLAPSAVPTGSSGLSIQQVRWTHQQPQQHQQGHHRDAASSPLVELRRLRQLVREADATNSKLDKERILSDFSDLQPLLAFLYDAHSRLHITSGSLKRHLDRRKADADWQHNVAPRLTTSSNKAQARTKRTAMMDSLEQRVDPPETLLELFQMLRQRRVTGGMALATVAVFLQRHGILAEHDDALSDSSSGDAELDNRESIRKVLMKPTVLEIFMRCIDRNLQAGFGEKMLVQAFNGRHRQQQNDDGNDAAENGTAADKESGKGKQRLVDEGDAGNGSVPGMKTSTFEVALGKTVMLDELPEIFTSKQGEPQGWFASRKLDGIRCIIFVDFDPDLPSSPDRPLVIQSIQTLSRTGREFTTLELIKADLAATLPSNPTIRAMVEQELVRSPQLCHQRVRLVLDGETCMLTRPPDGGAAVETDAVPEGDQGAFVAVANPNASKARQQHPGRGERETFVENFRAISGAIRRKKGIVPRPRYFPFDLLTEREFTLWRGKVALVDGAAAASSPPSSPDTEPAYVAHRPFSSRVSTLQSVVRWCHEAKPGQSRTLRQLEQHLVRGADEVDPLITTALEQGWEGLMLRHSSSIYVGKRSAHLLKLKQWQDAEYRIEAVNVAPMRLSLGGGGGYRVCDGVASVTIRHNGIEVRVGSGFTTKQRVEWAKHPERIRGKWCTVEYFAESQSNARDGKVGAAGGAGAGAGGGDGGGDGGDNAGGSGGDSDSDGVRGAEQDKASAELDGGRSLRFPRIKQVYLEGGRDM
ncbi:uncharacterized protein PFL1_04112 [Pseudozyma flocculosa PF-1]|nr:uncharacterized protein PFL1_04112 [Pseudozyma flocculosa PF-1]EPQ28285.1 hypothetical protein PFL1_04112 [Pseudozyma flocculosa PF-1]